MRTKRQQMIDDTMKKEKYENMIRTAEDRKLETDGTGEENISGLFTTCQAPESGL